MMLTKAAHQAGKAAAHDEAERALAKEGKLNREDFASYTGPVIRELDATQTPEELVGFCRGLLTATRFSYPHLGFAVSEALRNTVRAYVKAACDAVGAGRLASNIGADHDR